MDAALGSNLCQFDVFRLDRNAGVVLRLAPDGAAEPVPLGSRAFDVLCLLVERAGTVVSKQEIMQTVWPDTAVEDHNLTVQISTLRRGLASDLVSGSCIQTIPGRGYRFAAPVTWLVGDESAARVSPSAPTTEPLPPARPAIHRRPWFAVWLAAACVVLVAVAGGAAWYTTRVPAAPAAPRLSIVVLPFQNLSDDPKDDYLVDGITDDLTSDLAHIPEAFVIGNASARTLKGRAVNAKQIGQELGVRYVIEGSVRRIGDALRVNVQLVSCENGVYVWSDRFDQPIADFPAALDAILARMRGALGISLIEVEVARSRRAPPVRPDAFDLILRARALRNQPPSQSSSDEITSLYEQALKLDPSSVLALSGLAARLIDGRAERGYWERYEDYERAGALLARAKAIAPTLDEVLIANTYWLRTTVGCREAMPAAQQLIDLYPNKGAGYNFLGWCKTATGHAEEEGPLLETLIRLNPLDPNLFNAYRRMGYAALLLGRDRDAIMLLEQSLTMNPNARGIPRQYSYRQLAVAFPCRRCRAGPGCFGGGRQTLSVRYCARSFPVRCHS